ncbi:ABC transporter ATP-binding protein [Kitasatospora sp. NPDC054939]
MTADPRHPGAAAGPAPGPGTAAGPAPSATPGPAADPAAAPGRVRSLGRILLLLRRAAPGASGLTLALAVLAGLLPTALAWQLKLLMDGLAAGRGTAELAPVLGALAAAGVLQAVLPHVQAYLEDQITRAVSAHVQDELFGAVNRIPGLGPFEDPVFLDRLRLAEQAGATVPGQVLGALFGAARTVVTVAGLLGVLLAIGPLLALAAALAAVPGVVGRIRNATRLVRMMSATGNAVRRQIFYQELLTDLQALKEVRLFGLGDFLRTRMRTEQLAVHRQERELARRVLGQQAPLALGTALLSALGLLWAVGRVADGALTLGGLTAFTAALAGLQTGLAQLAVDGAAVHQGILLHRHYDAVVTVRPEPPVQPAPTAPPARPAAEPPARLPALRTGLDLRDVWFRYTEDGPWVLRGVDLTIPYGSSLALVGLNGAGKSTLVKLLCRFYEPTRGSIRWDGTDLRNVPHQELRRRLGAVFQDYMSYDLTAAENIALGDLDRAGDRAAVELAARRAGLHDRLAALPKGYDTLLSRIFFADSPAEEQAASGALLSGGQWQRLALARAYFREGRDLLILDEPSANVDAEAEHEIHEQLRRHRTGATSLLISHRLGAVRGADRIVVLADGRITEQGDHAELLAAGGEYARLFRLQAAGYAAAV